MTKKRGTMGPLVLEVKSTDDLYGGEGGAIHSYS